MLEESTGNFSATRNVYDWYQDNSHVIINIMIKNLKETDVKVKLIDETLDVTCNLADGSEFKLHFNLFKPIFVAESSWSVTPSKLEIKLKKTDRKRWQSLEVLPTEMRGGHKRSSSNAGFLHHANTIKRFNSSLNNQQTNTTIINTITPVDDDKPKVKYDWFQTNNQVKINIHISNLNHEDVRIELTEKTLDCLCALPNGNHYSLNLNLFKPIYIEPSSYHVTSSKLEITLVKQEHVRWTNLEAPLQLLEHSSNNNNNSLITTSNNSATMTTNSNNHQQQEMTTFILCSDPSTNESILQQVSLTPKTNENNGTINVTEVNQSPDLNQSSDLNLNDGIKDDNVLTGSIKTADNTDNNEYEVVFSKDKELAELDKAVREFKEKEKKNEEKGVDGDVDELLKEIYEKGGEEVRRAMSKSFNESGGLC